MLLLRGAAGFLGSFLVKKIAGLGAADILVPRIEHYNLVERDDIRRLLDDAMLHPTVGRLIWSRPGFQPLAFDLNPSELVILHLAAAWVGLVPIVNTRLNSSTIT